MVNAPYNDEIQDHGRILIYEGHDLPKTFDVDNAKVLDQPMHTKTGKLTQNGLFYEAAKMFSSGKRVSEIVRVYEKLKVGIWVYNGQFELIDAWLETVLNRKVFKFKLRVQEDESDSEIRSPSITLEHNRLIPSTVKVEVWKRDKGVCVKCGSDKNLHYDHIIPYSKGGTSLTSKNIQLLCMSCNISKSNKIE
jgi:hypothetical protein